MTESTADRRPGIAANALVAASFALALLPSSLWGQDAGVRRALLIGVGDYAVNDSGGAASLMAPADLGGPENDVALLTRVLTTRFGFQPENIITLIDDQADRAGILGALQRIVAAAGPEDAVYIHFSGLGSRVATADGVGRNRSRDTILPYDARLPGIADITEDELRVLLGGLHVASALVVLDTGHDPMPVADGSEVQVRAAGQDERADLYLRTDGAEPGGDSGPSEGAEYVLVSAAAPGQFALESPIEGGPSFGWLSWAMARALDVADQPLTIRDAGSSAQQSMDDLGIRMGLRSPALRLAGTEAALDRSLLSSEGIFSGTVASATRAWFEAIPRGAGRVDLAQGELFGGAAGSLWGIFPPGTSDFAGVEMLATAEVVEVRGGEVLARVDGGADVPDGSRAVLMAPPPPSDEVTVWLRRAGQEGMPAVRDAIKAAARSQVKFVDSAQGARFIVTFDTRGCRVFGPGGLQELARFAPGDAETIADLAVLLDRSVTVAQLQALENPSASLRIWLSVNPIDVDGMPRTTRVTGARPIPTFRVRQQGESRAPDNSLMVSFRVDRRSYVTVVDIGPEGRVSQLFPNPVSDANLFFADGLVPGGTEIRVPDSLIGGNANFYIDYEPPGGPDTLRVFATTNPVTAQRLRAYLAIYMAAAEPAGEPPPFTEIFLPLEAEPVLEVGTPETGFGAAAGIGKVLPTNFVDWAAASISFRVDE